MHRRPRFREPLEQLHVCEICMHVCINVICTKSLRDMSKITVACCDAGWTRYCWPLCVQSWWVRLHVGVLGVVASGKC